MKPLHKAMLETLRESRDIGLYTADWFHFVFSKNPDLKSEAPFFYEYQYEMSVWGLAIESKDYTGLWKLAKGANYFYEKEWKPGEG